MRLHAGLITRLFPRFVYQCVLSGASTVRIVLQRKQPHAGFVRMRFAPMSETGAAVLGAMVTLTPGARSSTSTCKNASC